MHTMSNLLICVMNKILGDTIYLIDLSNNFFDINYYKSYLLKYPEINIKLKR